MRPFILALCCALLTACHASAPTSAPSPLTFLNAPYRLNVAVVNTAVDYRMPKRAPHVEHLAMPPLPESAKRWAVSRLVAAGGGGTVDVLIGDASITRRDIPKAQHGLSAVLTKEQTEAYDGALSVTVKLYNGQSSLPAASMQLHANASRTLREDATDIDRQAAYDAVSADLIRSIDGALNEQIHTYFSPYLL